MRDVQPASKTFTFTNGVTVQVTPLSPFFLSKLNALAQRELRDSKPVPPVLKTDFGETTNPADPGFVAAANAWFTRVGYTMFARGAAMAVTIDPAERERGLATIPALKAALADEATRYQAMLAEAGLDDEPNDFEAFTTVPGAEHPTVQYLLYIGANGSHAADLYRLMDMIRGAGEEQEAAVEIAAESFPGQAEGQVDLAVSAA
jgi:hypothetical protein